MQIKMAVPCSPRMPVRRYSLQAPHSLTAVASVVIAVQFACGTPPARGQCSPDAFAHLYASDGMERDYFGRAMALDGDYAIVGAEGDDFQGLFDCGTAYVFFRTGGVWSQQAHLFASDRSPDDQFGDSAAISGDTIVVGVPLDDNPGGNNAGSVYVFVRDGDTWTEQAHLFASDGAAGDYFGRGVAISGDTVVVGAPYGETPEGGSYAGSAYVFVRNGDVWTEQDRLFGLPETVLDQFGTSIAMTSEAIVVGTFNLNSNSNKAYFFEREGNKWTEVAHFVKDEGDLFGGDVAISGDTAVVAASSDETPDGNRAGSVFVYKRDGNGWAEDAHLFANNGHAGDRFGQSVGIRGDLVVVGASEVPANAFIRTGDTWSFAAELMYYPEDSFGSAVATDGNEVWISTPSLFDGTNFQEGSVHIFDPAAPDIVVHPDSQMVVEDTTVEMGSDVCSNLPVTFQWRRNDIELIDGPTGLGSVIEGATLPVLTVNHAQLCDDGRYEVVVTNEQAVVHSDVAVLTVNPDNGPCVPDELAQLRDPEGLEDDRFGYSVSISGDTAIVGAPQETGIGTGTAYVFARNGNEWIEESQIFANDGMHGDRFGRSVAIDGNTAVVGAWRADPRGAAYVLVQDEDDWVQQAQLLPTADGGLSEFGVAVAISGNTIVVADTAGALNGERIGAVYIYVRTGDTWTEQAYLTNPDAVEGNEFGHSVAIWEDLVVVGAGTGLGSPPLYAWIFERTDGVWIAKQALRAPSDDAFGFGVSVAISGNRIIVGADLALTPVEEYAGAAYVYVRGDEPGNPEWILETVLYNPNGGYFELFGRSVALDNDAAIVGAYFAQLPNGDGPGVAYLFPRGCSVWGPPTVLYSPSAADAAWFGCSVAISNHTAFIGACYDEPDVGIDTGAAYAFDIPSSCDQFPHSAALTRAASVLVHDEGGPNEAPRFHDLLAANGIEPRRGGPEAIYFEVEQDVDAATIDPENVNVTCLNQTPAAHSVFLFDTDIFVVELDEALTDQDCCTIDYAGVRTVGGAPVVGPFDVRSLEGDMNFDGAVTGGDALLIKTHLGEEVNPFEPHWDFDRSGFVTGGDFALIKPRFDNVAPACR